MSALGLREHCLDGDFLIIAATSSAVTGLKVSSGTSTFLLTTDGQLKFAVDCRIRSIFASK